MPYSAKRIQVLLRPVLLETVEQFAEEQGLTNSKACALLIDEAVRARGLTVKTEPSPVEDLKASLPPEVADKVQMTTVTKKTEPLPADDAQMLKLKLMQELMDQLKTM